MIETILVTVATGNVGSEVIKQLVAPSFSSSGHSRIKAAFHSQNTQLIPLRRTVKKFNLLTPMTTMQRLLLML
jgi:uncharacterized protein YbjT (DUF2867 family)